MPNCSCKYFTGVQNKECEKGVLYAQFQRQADGQRLPCLASGKDLPCEHRQYPTKEEIEAEEKMFDEIIKESKAARAAVLKHSGGKRGVAGSIPCTKCKTGTLHYSIAACNGHIHGRCTTAECLSWME